MATMPSITWKLPSARTPINSAQADFFAAMSHELIQAARATNFHAIAKLPEYSRFIGAAYACGFVCRDLSPDPTLWSEVLSRPSSLADGEFKRLRHFIHYMLRAERHADAGSEDGGGSVLEALRSDALLVIAERLGSGVDVGEL